MKKIVSILILFIFLISTVGVIASTYYCKMAMPAGKSCCKTSDSGCCEKNSKLLKITEDYIPSSFQLPVKSIIDIPPSQPCNLFTVEEYLPIFVSLHSDHAPPENSKEVLVLIQSFRI